MSYPSKVNPAVSSAITSAINSNNSSVVVPGDQARSNAIVNTTWANRATAIAAIAALTPSTGWVNVTDVGIGGSMWYCDGTQLSRKGQPIALQLNGTPQIVPSLAAANAATYSQTGTTITVTSVGHNLPATDLEGGNVYLVIGSGLATTGWYTNFSRTGVDTFTCTSSVSQTTSGTVNTNNAITTITPLDYTLKGGLMGLNGIIEEITGVQVSGGANNKVYYGFGFLSGGVSTVNGTLTTQDVRCYASVQNCNSESRQAFTATTVSGFGTLDYRNKTVNTAADSTHNTTVSVANASEFIAIRSRLLQINPN